MNILILVLLFFAKSSVMANSEPHSKSKQHEGGEAMPAPVKVKLTDGYVHEWKNFPTIEGQNIYDGKTVTFGAHKGRMFVAYFIASWCVPCQSIITNLRTVETKNKDVLTDFIYIFTHDTQEDAVTFARTYKIKNAVLANHEMLKNFKNPELPAVYFSDRKGWLAGRYLKATSANIQQLDSTILKFSVF